MKFCGFHNFTASFQSTIPYNELESYTFKITATLWGQWVITLRLRQDGHHFPDDIFKWIFLNENIWLPIKISLKFVPKGPINNIPTLVQIMTWRRPGDKPLSESMLSSLRTHICVTRPQWVNSLPTHLHMWSYSLQSFFLFNGFFYAWHDHYAISMAPFKKYLDVWADCLYFCLIRITGSKKKDSLNNKTSVGYPQWVGKKSPVSPWKENEKLYSGPVLPWCCDAVSMLLPNGNTAFISNWVYGSQQW